MADSTPDETWSGILPDLLRYPVSGALSGAAIVASLYYWTGGDIDPFVMSYRAFTTEPWRLFTSCLLHVNFFHLAFNVYWLLYFGGILETREPRFGVALLFIYLAAGSSAADYALDEGGIGLSGIGYGLFGFTWIAGRRDAAYAGSVDRGIAGMFVAWFFFCIVLTELGVWSIANVAHGAGAVFGALGGLARFGAPAARKRWASVAAAAAVLVLWSATDGRTLVNRGDGIAYERSLRAYDVMESEGCEAAVPLYEEAVAIEDDWEDDWYFLGVCYQELERHDDALPVLQRAYDLDADDEANVDALVDTLRALLQDAERLGRPERVVELWERLGAIVTLEASDWESLARAYEGLGRNREARDAYTEALRMAPEDGERYQRELTRLSKP